MNENDVFKNIVNSKKFIREKKFVQHGSTSVYEHSISVATTCLEFVEKFNIKVDKNSLVKGALLHDYFLYDWHDKESWHRLHGIRHPKFAKDNAKRDFELNKKEENMILAHMFPLGIVIPRYIESIILCLIDKYCALKETCHEIVINIPILSRIIRNNN